MSNAAPIIAYYFAIAIITITGEIINRITIKICSLSIFSKHIKQKRGNTTQHLDCAS